MNSSVRTMALAGTREFAEISAVSDEQKIVDRIYHAVMEQRLPPRTKLGEAELCESFEVGRMKVRRALLLLASQGIVDLQSNRGAFVACPTQKDANEVFEARLHIEPSLVRQVARTVNPEGLRILSEHVEQEKVARQNGERTELIRLTGEFHVKIAIVSGNSLLVRTLRELATRTSLVVGLFGTERSASCREDEHEMILAAIKDGDEELASVLVRGHLRHIQEHLDLSRTKRDEPDLVSLLRAK